MSPAVLGLCLLAWTGATMVLSRHPWFARPALAGRIGRYLPGSWSRSGPPGLGLTTFRQVLAPFVERIGAAVGRFTGGGDELATRLERIHSPLDTTAARLRQAAWSAASFGAAGLLAAAGALPADATVLVLVAAPIAVWIAIDQSYAEASRRWQRQVFLELPITCEHLGVLLGAGYSIGAALDRTASRSTGSVGRDLARVTGRIRQGLGERAALREWASIAQVPAVDRLVAVLALDHETGDLGRLVAEETRSIRLEVQRDLSATVQRRAQQVWIPVTVATLVPGTLFIAVPFVQALRLFAVS